MMQRPRPAQAAFSLVELMTVLAVIAVLVGVGVPSFETILRGYRLNASVNGFAGAIHVARSEAIRRGARVDLVPVNGRDWAAGWIVFIDKNENQRADAGESVIARYGPVPGGMAIKSVFTDSSKPYLAYNGSGRTRTNASNQTPQLGTISFTLGKGVRRIKLNFSGRPRVCNPEKDKTCTGTDDAD